MTFAHKAHETPLRAQLQHYRRAQAREACPRWVVKSRPSDPGLRGPLRPHLRPTPGRPSMSALLPIATRLSRLKRLTHLLDSLPAGGVNAVLCQQLAGRAATEQTRCRTEQSDVHARSGSAACSGRLVIALMRQEADHLQISVRIFFGFYCPENTHNERGRQQRRPRTS
jgi:hypothetical protein